MKTPKTMILILTILFSIFSFGLGWEIVECLNDANKNILPAFDEMQWEAGFSFLLAIIAMGTALLGMTTKGDKNGDKNKEIRLRSSDAIWIRIPLKKPAE
jgi:hypothetical protein